MVSDLFSKSPYHLITPLQIKLLYRTSIFRLFYQSRSHLKTIYNLITALCKIRCCPYLFHSFQNHFASNDASTFCSLSLQPLQAVSNQNKFIIPTIQISNPSCQLSVNIVISAQLKAATLFIYKSFVGVTK